MVHLEIRWYQVPTFLSNSWWLTLTVESFTLGHIEYLAIDSHTDPPVTPLRLPIVCPELLQCHILVLLCQYSVLGSPLPVPLHLTCFFIGGVGGSTLTGCSSSFWRRIL